MVLSKQIKGGLTPQENHTVLWNTLIINQRITSPTGRVLIINVPFLLDRLVLKILADRARYQSVSGQFKNPIRWYHIAIIHYLECSLDFTRYLGNGQPLNRVTTIVPKGRGPFASFEAGAIDAIRLKGLDKITDWSIGNTLYLFEGYNGYGYSKYQHTNSPYLYSGSNHYKAGKYVKDGVFDKNAVSTQIGAALILKTIFHRLEIPA